MTVAKPPTPIGKNFNPGNARWCDEHGRLECTKQRRHGRGMCHRIASRGADACHLHAGIRKSVLKAKGEAVITAYSVMGDTSKVIDAPTAVLGVLHMSWLRLNGYAELLKLQLAGESADDFDPNQLRDPKGLIGFRYGAAGKDGHIYAQSEEVRALVLLEAAERERVVKFAKTAYDMKISDRLASVAEIWTDVVATKVSLILAGLELTEEQRRKAPHLIVEHLSAIEMGIGEGEKR